VIRAGKRPERYLLGRSPWWMMSMYPSAVRQFPIIADTFNLAALPSRICHCFLGGTVLSQGSTQSP
jgi:hypothetical protein